MTRQPNWDIDRVRGETAEALVSALRSALLVGECEVKCDDKAAETGNIFVEYACNTSTGWQPSGIAVTKAANWVWVLLDMRVVVWMPVWLLKNIAREHGRKVECITGSHPTKGVVISLDTLLSEARRAVNVHDQAKAA